MTSKHINYFLAIILTAFSLSLNAAEEATANSEESEELVLSSAEEESEIIEEQSEGDDDFVPSAQISEDLSVSFPVDI